MHLYFMFKHLFSRNYIIDKYITCLYISTADLIIFLPLRDGTRMFLWQPIVAWEWNRHLSLRTNIWVVYFQFCVVLLLNYLKLLLGTYSLNIFLWKNLMYFCYQKLYSFACTRFLIFYWHLNTITFLMPIIAWN